MRNLGLSLIELMCKEEYAGLVFDDELTVGNVESLDKCLHDFLDLMEGKAMLSSTPIEEKKLAKVSNELAMSLCGLITGKKVDSNTEAIALLNEVKSFFVAPEDLLNALNLEKVGFLNASLLRY